MVGELAVRTVPNGVAPAAVAPKHDPTALVESYVASLQSPRSRSTMREGLRRIARLSPLPEPIMTGDGLAALLLMVPEEQTWTLLNALRSELAKNYPPATANLSLSALRGLLRTAFLQGMLTDRQYALLKELKSVKGSRITKGVALSLEHERMLRAEARELPSYQGAMFETMISTSIGAGLRRNELCPLAVDALGPDSLQVLGKGNKERRPVVDAQMRELLDSWVVRRDLLHVDHKALFVSPERPDSMLSPWTYGTLLREVAHQAFGSERQSDRGRCPKTCRCRKILTGPHDFRRTFATRLLEKGYDLREVQILMGHESVATTQRYDKRSEDKLYERRRQTVILAEV